MKTILMVDDNDQLRETLASMLPFWAEDKDFDVRIIEKVNGAEALAWVQEHGQPDLLLLDVRMPVMDGAEFLRQIAAMGLDFRPCTLLLTGYADDLEVHLGSEALLMRHLRKPFMATELFAILDQMVRK